MFNLSKDVIIKICATLEVAWREGIGEDDVDEFLNEVKKNYPDVAELYSDLYDS